MYFKKRSGTLLLGCVAASFLFASCQSPQQPQGGEREAAPVIAEPVEVSVDTPDGADSKSVVPETPVEVVEKKPKARVDHAIERQATRLGAVLERNLEEKEWILSKGERRLVLRQDSRIAVLDGVKVILDAPFRTGKSGWALSESDVRLVLDSAFGAASRRQEPVLTVVVDPGHGGSEDGAKNEILGVLEKEMALDVSLRLQAHLEEAGFKVVLTRYDDRSLGLDERAEIANGLDADLFVSVHFNAALNTEASGLETFMLTPPGYPSSSDTEMGDDAIAYPGNRFDRENFRLAYRVQDTLLSRLGREDRGVKKARFRVLKSLDCPGVLVECGFISNPSEGLLVSTAGYRERVAQALTDAIIAYSNFGGEGESSSAEGDGS